MTSDLDVESLKARKINIGEEWKLYSEMNFRITMKEAIRSAALNHKLSLTTHIRLPTAVSPSFSVVLQEATDTLDLALTLPENLNFLEQ